MEKATEEKVIKKVNDASNCLDLVLFHVKQLHEMVDEINMLSVEEINRLSERDEVIAFERKYEELRSLI